MGKYVRVVETACSLPSVFAFDLHIIIMKATYSLILMRFIHTLLIIVGLVEFERILSVLLERLFREV
jgi:hypothetical protein